MIKYQQMEERPHLYIIPIAQRIRKTLPDGKTGLLFIGASHDVGSHLGVKSKYPREMVNCALPEVLRDFYDLGRERK